MKIVAATANHHGSGYYRTLVPLRAVSVRGHAVSLVIGPTLADCADAHVLFLPLAQTPGIAALAEAFRARGGRVVYELDDDVRATAAGNPARTHPQYAERVTRMLGLLAAADRLVVATPVLAAAYRDLHPDIRVCPNAIDPQDAAPFFGRGEPPPASELRIGFAGSASHEADVAAIAAPVARVLRARPHVRFVLLGADFRPLFPDDVRARVAFLGHTFPLDESGAVREFCRAGETWPAVAYLHALAAAGLHVAIAPLVDDAFNRAKSWLKLIEYGALGLPAVASDVGPYRAYAEQGGGAGAVALANDEAAWERSLLELIDSPERRDALRRANRANVLRAHLVYHTADAWEAALTFD